MVDVPPLRIKLTLWDFLLHVTCPGRHTRYVLDDARTVVPNYVPAVFTQGGLSEPTPSHFTHPRDPSYTLQTYMIRSNRV